MAAIMERLPKDLQRRVLEFIPSKHQAYLDTFVEWHNDYYKIPFKIKEFEFTDNGECYIDTTRTCREFGNHETMLKRLNVWKKEEIKFLHENQDFIFGGYEEAFKEAVSRLKQLKWNEYVLEKRYVKWYKEWIYITRDD